MVSSVSYQLGKNRKITGFGRRTCGRGVIRRTVGAISRPALTFVANKIADMITGTGKTYRKRRSGGSYKLPGAGYHIKPRKTTGRKPKSNNINIRISGVGVRKPRKTLGTRRRRVY